MRALVFWLLAVAPAAADPYDDHMHNAERAEARSRWADALLEREAALAARPGDATALTEIGWAALHAGNLERARTASEAAVMASSDNAQLRGAALYNLALAVEKDDAYAAASLAFAGYWLRPNRVVADRLVKLQSAMKRALSAQGKALLARVHVNPLPLPRRGSKPAAPIDRALAVALGRAGVEQQGAAAKMVYLVEDLACSGDSATRIYSCTSPPATGDVARAIVLNLVERKLAGQAKGTQIAYSARVSCTEYIDGDAPPWCEVNAR